MPWTKPFGKLFRSFSLLFSDSRASLFPALKDGVCARQNLIKFGRISNWPKVFWLAEPILATPMKMG